MLDWIDYIRNIKRNSKYFEGSDINSKYLLHSMWFWNCNSAVCMVLTWKQGNIDNCVFVAIYPQSAAHKGTFDLNIILLTEYKYPFWK